MRFLFILTCFYLFSISPVCGQLNSFDEHYPDRSRIDSLSEMLDKHSRKSTSSISFNDTLAGEKIISVKKYWYKKIIKYSLETSQSEPGMRVNHIDLYLYQNRLIQVAVFYDKDKRSFWKRLYFKDDVWFQTSFHPHCMRVAIEENTHEYVEFANKLNKLIN